MLTFIVPGKWLGSNENNNKFIRKFIKKRKLILKLLHVLTLKNTRLYK